MCERHAVGTVIKALFGAQPEARPEAETPVRPEGGRGRRRRLWELEERYLCPVVGSCLSLAELKTLARRNGYRGQDFDAYRLHVEAVSVAGTRNAASERMQTVLERKYAGCVHRFKAARSDEAVLALWREHFDCGEVAGALWAAMTHGAASAETRHRIYADVHMLSHQVSAGAVAEQRRMHAGGYDAEARQRDAEKLQRQTEALVQERARSQRLEAECARLRAQLSEVEPLRARLAALESGQVMVDMGRRLLMLEAANADLRAKVCRAEALEARLRNLQTEVERLARERDDLAAERDALEQFCLPEVEAAADACSGECANCPERLHGRCVLCVGGRTPLLAQYRRLAERLGVRLIHHDGGREDAMSRLPELLAASDAVICPTDSVSHAAYRQLKRHCKAMQKPCVLARSSGVAGFAAALARLAGDRPDPRNKPLHPA